jgi:anthranilate phosphoribosyltransferase
MHGTEDPVLLSNDTVAKIAAEAGLAALSGEPGLTKDSLVYGAALCLWHLGRYDSLGSAANAVRTVLTSGAALRRFTP